MQISVLELKRRNRGYWLAIQVTHRNRLGIPTRGQLLARGRTHRELHARLKNEPDHDVYETYGGKVPIRAILI